MSDPPPEKRSLIKLPSQELAKSRSYLAKRGLSLLKSNNEEKTKGWLESLGAKFELDETGRVCRVDLGFTQVTDEGLVHLAGLTNLRNLGLYGTQITDDGLDELKKVLPDCTIVY